MWESIGFKAGLVVIMKRDDRKANDKVPSRGLTHAGVFHADDVFATALLRTLNPHIEVVRSNVVPRGFDGIVYDIGGGEFDHHARDARKRANGMPFSSFGLIWGKYWSLLLCDDDAAEFDKDFVQPIDLADNGGPTCFATQCVADFNPCGTTVHAQTYGWLGWARNDSPAGTAGYGKRLEGIQVVMLPKGANPPGSTSRAFVQR